MENAGTFLMWYDNDEYNCLTIARSESKIRYGQRYFIVASIRLVYSVGICFQLNSCRACGVVLWFVPFR